MFQKLFQKSRFALVAANAPLVRLSVYLTHSPRPKEISLRGAFAGLADDPYGVFRVILIVYFLANKDGGWPCLIPIYPTLQFVHNISKFKDLTPNLHRTF